VKDTYYAVWYSGSCPAVFRATIPIGEAMIFETFDALQMTWTYAHFDSVKNWIDWVPLDELPGEVQEYERRNTSIHLHD
jgi:hypothetical protein